jgi:hypothetical protein
VVVGACRREFVLVLPLGFPQVGKDGSSWVLIQGLTGLARAGQGRKNLKLQSHPPLRILHLVII